MTVKTCSNRPPFPTQASLNNPELIAQQLHLLLEDAIVEAHVSNNQQSARLAKEMAEILVNQFT